METKKAIVLDTNYIIANRSDFKKKIEELTEKFDLFIPEVCIRERSGQQYVEWKNKYDEINIFEDKYKELIEIKFKKNIKNLEDIENLVEETYKSLNNVKFIPIDEKGKMYEETMKRACRKMAPFSKDKNASDKGFKDALLWVSLLNYFKENLYEKDIILITSDSSFEKRADELRTEFFDLTGKSIEFKDNSYTKEILGDSIESLTLVEQNEMGDISSCDINELRNEIDSALFDMYYEEIEDMWGESHLTDRFNLKSTISNDDVIKILYKINILIDDNMLNKYIDPEDIFIDICEIESNYKIPIEKLEKLKELWMRIQSRYSNIQGQFIKSIADYINERINSDIELDDVPF